MENEIILQGITQLDLIENIKIALKEVINESKIDKDKEDEIMTRDEVCDLLSIVKSTLWKRTKMGKIPAYKQGRRLYYKKSEVLNSLKN